MACKNDIKLDPIKTFNGFVVGYSSSYRPLMLNYATQNGQNGH